MDNNENKNTNENTAPAEKNGSGDDTAEELPDPVAAGILPAHPLAEDYAEGDCRVDVATGDTADCVSHRDD